MILITIVNGVVKTAYNWGAQIVDIMNIVDVTDIMGVMDIVDNYRYFMDIHRI